MKASKLLNEIRENLKDYPIDYLKNKVTDDRYKDPLTKSLAKYNSGVYDEIYEKELENDFKINDGVVQKIKGDIKNGSFNSDFSICFYYRLMHWKFFKCCYSKNFKRGIHCISGF